MKKILCVLLILTLVFTMSACGKGKTEESELTPMETADAFLQALKAGDYDTMQQYYEGDVKNITLQEGIEDPALTGLIDKLLDKVLDFDYTLDNEKVESDSATVDVIFATYDLGGLMEDLITNILSDAVALSISNFDQEELEAEINEIMSEKFGEAIEKAEKNKSITVPLQLVKKKDKWLVKDLTSSEDFMNALSGGLIEFSDSLGSLFG